jgi:sec-independent protein translocase protein TatC
MASAVKAVRGVGHEDRLTLIEHLDELRSRLIVSVIFFAVVFSVCLWQNNALLHILNKPLSETTQSAIKKGDGLTGEIDKNRQALLGTAQSALAITKILEAPKSGVTPRTRALLAPAEAQLQKSLKLIPKSTEGAKPVTLGVGEPFSTTLTVTLYFALLFSLPFLLYQIYAFLLPAFTPEERKIALPLMSMVPVLFILGVIFGYFLVLPPAVQFLQNFNSDSFNVLVQANQYYKFAVMTLIALGIVFQLPVAILAATRLGVVTPKQLRKNRRYAVVIIAIIAMILPGTDPVSMLLDMVPLLILYEVSIVLSVWFGKPKARSSDDDDDGPTLSGGDDDDDPDGPHEDDPLLGPDDQVLVPVGADWDPEDGNDDDEWEERPHQRDSGGAGELS